MVINTANYISELIVFIRNRLRTTVTDPVTRSGNQSFIVTSYPARDVIYPIITITQAGGSVPERLGFRSEQALASVDLEVRVWAKNSKQRDTLSESVINSLRNSQLSSTIDAQIYGFAVTSISEVNEEGSAGIKSKIIIFNYKLILST